MTIINMDNIEERIEHMNKAKKTGTQKKLAKRQRGEILLLMSETELAAIVKPERVELSAKSPFRTTIYCKALDSFGLVYDLQLKFSSKNTKRKKKILTDLKEDTVHLVKGQYTLYKRDFIIMLIEPEYMPIPQDLSEEDVREAFRVNIKAHKS